MNKFKKNKRYVDKRYVWSAYIYEALNNISISSSYVFAYCYTLEIKVDFRIHIAYVSGSLEVPCSVSSGHVFFDKKKQLYRFEKIVSLLI